MKRQVTALATGLLLMNTVSFGQTNNYFGISGSLNGNVWSTLPGGPYTSALNTTGGAVINFNNPAIVTGASITVAGINANATVSAWTPGGTLSTGGTVVPVTVGAGSVLTINQGISAAAGTGINKLGGGVLLLGAGSAYNGGFTLTSGTIVAGGVNALGNGTLTLNSGVICADGNRDLSGRYPGGIIIGGDVQFGETAPPAVGLANLTFSDNMSLGALNRTFTLGHGGIISFGGIIANTAGTGITFSANSNGTGLFDVTGTVNTFSGPVNIDGGEVRFADNGSFGNVANVINIDGGRLRTDAGFTITHPVQVGISPGTAINVTAGNLVIAGVMSNKSGAGSFTKTGAGILTLTRANTYTGTTYIAAGGGTLQLHRPAGNTLPATNTIVVNGGVLQVSSNQTLNDLTLAAGNLTIDNGVTLTINGTLDYFQPASITLIGTGKIVYGPAGVLKYSGTVARVASANEWPVVNPPFTVICNNTAGVSLPMTGTINGGLVLNAGTFTIAAGGLLDMNGASLSVAGGTLAGNASADLMVRGNTGGTITIPAAISLRNLTVGDTRTLALNGTSNLSLYGTLSVAANAVFDNGGESQVINSGGNVLISGTFINRDKDNFTGTNGALPTIPTVLAAGSTVIYCLAGNQLITKRDDYANLIFSNGGIKTLANACTPAGTVYIKDNTTVDAGIHVFGNALTNLTMEDGRLILRGINNPQPHMAGTYNLTGGVIQFDCNSISGQTIRSQTYKNIEVTGAYTGNSNGNITLAADGSFTIKSGAVFEMNDNAITGPSGNQTITVETNATFKCGNALGFNGPLVGLNSPAVRDNIENIVLQPNSTVNYSRSNPPQVSGDQVITNTLPYQHLVVSGNGGTKTAPSGMLVVLGNLVKTGTSSFNHNNGTVLLNGNNQIFAGLPYNNLRLDNPGVKTLTGDASIADSLQLSNLQTSPATELSLGENYMTLLSNADKTARVGSIPNSAGVKINYGVNGRFVVERYYPPKRAWRLITAPVTADAIRSTVFKSWQHSGATTTLSGTFITGKNANPLVNGLDVSPYNNSSLKTFDNNAQQVVPVTNTKTQLIAGTSGVADNIGFFLFVRGDRSTSNLFNPPFANSTTLRDTGKLLIKDQAFLLSGPVTPGFNLVGNPYASPVKVSSIVANTPGIDNGVFYTWDPNLNAQHGGYITMTYSLVAGGKWIATPPSPDGKQDSIIQSGQAFFVKRTAPAASMVFTETDKWLTGNTAVFRPAGTAKPESFSIRANLYLLNPDSTTTLADGIMVEFQDDYDNKVDDKDADKINNEKESLALLRENKLISVERRAHLTNSDTLFFNLKNSNARSYQLEFIPENADTLAAAFLEDHYTATSQPVSLQQASRFYFAVNKDSGSADPNRFRLVLHKQNSAATAVVSSVTAERKGDAILIRWEVSDDTKIGDYSIEKSLDGVHFREVNKVAAKREHFISVYQWPDTSPLTGDNFYRIKSRDDAGKDSYSAVVKVAWPGVTGDIAVYPNPVTDGFLYVYLFHQPPGEYHFRLINAAGQLISGKVITGNGENTLAVNLPVRNNLRNSTALLQIYYAGKPLSTLKIAIK